MTTLLEYSWLGNVRQLRAERESSYRLLRRLGAKVDERRASEPPAVDPQKREDGAG